MYVSGCFVLIVSKMQECGQPPAEIIQELAPGLEFDQDGQPIMPNMVGLNFSLFHATRVLELFRQYLDRNNVS